MKFIRNARLNLFILRGLTLLSRVIFLFFIARNMTVIEVGFYGFIAALIFATVFLVGFEYGNYSSRHIIKCQTFLCKQDTVVKLTIFGLIMFCIFAPLMYMATFSFGDFSSYQSIIDYNVVVYFLVIAYCESYIAEHKKILISLRYPVYSGIIDFVKSGIWAYLLIILVTFEWFELNIRSILLIWALFVLIGVILLAIKLKKYYSKVIFFSMPSINIYKNQIYSSFPFFLSGLFLVLIELSGRISLQMAGLHIQAGVYTFYAGFIFAVPLFVWSSSVALDHSKIIESHESGEIIKSDSLVIVMLKRSIMICFSLIIFLYFAFDLLIKMTEKEEYSSHINQFHLFLLVPILHVIDTHLYYMLYTRHLDKLIAISALTGGTSLAILQYFTVPNNGITSVIFSILSALTISVFLKIYFIRRSIISNQNELHI